MLEADFRIRRGKFVLDLRLDVERGDVVALLGPNGSGKSTALHALAGLVPVDSGHICLNDATIDDAASNDFIAPENRPVSLVFQNYLLFPHMDARDNVAFPLRARGANKAEARREAIELLKRFNLGEVTRHRPSQLSGGQAQRVALARALAVQPDLLLLDEPLAALDAGTRIEIRRDLRHHLSEFGGATILVTHDPLDALALATRVVVLDNGRVSQAGSIADLTARPRSRYVADLVGLNLFTGRSSGSSISIDGTDRKITTADSICGDVFVLIHPHAVSVHRSEPEGSPRNRWETTIRDFDLLGDKVRVRTSGSLPLVAEITTKALDDLDLHEGDHIWVAVKATEVSTYPR